MTQEFPADGMALTHILVCSDPLRLDTELLRLAYESKLTGADGRA